MARGVVPTPADNLHAELRSLIASSRQRLAGAVNAELTRLYWSVGKRLHTEVWAVLTAPSMATSLSSAWAINWHKNLAVVLSPETCATW